MPNYFVETYAPSTSEVGELVARAREAADGQVRYVRSLFVPEDETCFHMFEAPSAEAVVDVSRAEFAGARVVEAIEGRSDAGRPS